MKNTASQKLRLGIFIVLGTVIFVAALYFIGNRQNLFGKRIQLNAKFSNVNGLQLGNNVRYSGIDVGTVSKIRMQNDTVILVEMLIKENIRTHIKKDAIATIGSDGLVGNMIVNIIPAEGNLPSVTSGDTINTYSRIATDDMLTTLNVTNQNAALLTADLLKITTEIVEGKGTLGMLINDSTMAKDLKQTMFQLKNASTGATKTIAQLNEYLGQIQNSQSAANVLLTDTVAGNQVKTIVNKLDKSSDDIIQVTESLSQLLIEIEEGQGAVKYLTTNEDFVKDIDSVMTNIKESSKKFDENMEALKHNFLFRGYFKKLERQEKKANRKSN